MVWFDCISLFDEYMVCKFCASSLSRVCEFRRTHSGAVKISRPMVRVLLSARANAGEFGRTWKLHWNSHDWFLLYMSSDGAQCCDFQSTRDTNSTRPRNEPRHPAEGTIHRIDKLPSFTRDRLALSSANITREMSYGTCWPPIRLY